MSDDTSYLGEIQLFAFDYAPMDWAQCNGASLRISEFPLLYSLIGTTYGGNGTTHFQLPNLTGRAICGQGAGPGLTPRRVGDTFGQDTVTVGLEQMAPHSHGLNLYRQNTASLQKNAPADGDSITTPANVLVFQDATVTPDVDMAVALSPVTEAGSADHENRQPLVGLNFCISLRGSMPAFS